MNEQPKTRQMQLPTKVWIKLAVLLVIIVSTAALLITYVQISKLRDEVRQKQQQAMEMEKDNQNLKDYIDHKDTDEGIKDVATGELGMVDPDTVIYDFD